ncbi:serpin-like protein [Medicago truncatula]|uniref:Proteinase inhibitor I4, serpin n=1 Tax=Medicago truncatula TaxID=3880 RepID=Q2HSM8_MEDTR|nr:Proteinase inhibitor I4, serpin [Medicago truncatula]KEH22516.1 serpin-like protein [Medicago truncatula]
MARRRMMMQNLIGKSFTNLTNISMNITKHLLSNQKLKEENVVFSPLSLNTVLSMIATGSEGPTQKQLLSFLQSESTGDLKSLCSQLVSSVLSDGAPAGGPCLSYVNGVWVEQTIPLQPSFKQLMNTDFKAAFAAVDFVNKANEVGEEVNFWAEKETKGLIKNLLPPGSVNSLTRLIFANALYFKGVWKQQFDTTKTKDYDFDLLNGKSVKVPFMTSKNDQFISSLDGFKVLGLPYKQGKDERAFSIYFFLPDKKDGLSNLIDKVASDSEFLERNLPRRKVEVGKFRIPRFNISFEIEASELLKKLGLALPFTLGGLTKMVDSPISQELYVSGIFQKSFIEVNEEGTKAAAVTVSFISSRSRYSPPPPPPIDFVADHPFLFLIREEFSGTILFVGKVVNPLDG